MKASNFLILVLFFICIACSTFKDGQIYKTFSEEDIEVSAVEDSLFRAEIAYLGAVGHSYLFECSILNYSNNHLFVDKDQFAMMMNDLVLLEPADEDNLIEQLNQERSKLKKRKKTSMIIGGVLIGLSTLAGAAQGINPIENLAYNVDPVIGILEERRWYQEDIKTVEDEIKYIRAAQFNRDIIGPGESLTRDVLFPTTKVNTDVIIFFVYDDLEYTFTFPKRAFK